MKIDGRRADAPAAGTQHRTGSPGGRRMTHITARTARGVAGIPVGLMLIPARLRGATEGMIPGRPPDVSKYGFLIDGLLDRTTLLVSIWFLIVAAALTWFVIVYRSRKGHERGHYSHGTSKRAIALQGAIGLLVFATVDVQLVYLSHRHLEQAFYNTPETGDPVRIEVLAQQWAWNVRYPGPDGRFNTGDDIVTLNDMRVPVGRPVIVQLQAKDVIHSLFLPNVRLKQDAIPGTVTQFWFQCEEPGEFEMVCAEMCGLNHYLMRGEFRVLDREDFEAWWRQAGRISEIGFDPGDTDALWGWAWEES
jgi:cytochrome c oxidase subunit 2